MDKKDRKILYELDKNSRASFSHLGKAVKLSQETVRYRIHQLMRKGIIAHCITVLNQNMLGHSLYEIYFKLKKVNEEKKNAVIKYLQQSKAVAWIGNFEGKFDIGVIVMVPDQLSMQKFMMDFNNAFSAIMMKKTLSLDLKAEFFQRDYLIGKSRTTATALSYEMSEKKVMLDELDKNICRLLANNARMSSVDMGKKLKRSSDAILLRMKKLKKQGIIRGYALVIDNEKADQLHYKLLLYLQDAATAQKLLGFAKSNNRVFAIMHTLAEWDYEIDLEVETVQQLKDFTMELTDRFSESIKDYEVLRIVSMPKYDFYP
ncbi:Lrp/AsnC family transcriptional regulator [Candidatus Woesearchaeota archaeon]|nr:MAG: Lrp/AsnC family transcriptional regulator [Candidatus Woesearchaeota archaeon]